MWMILRTPWASCAPGNLIHQSKGSVGVQIGRDPRISGPLLAAALAAGLTSKGVRVARFGYATTPAMFMSTIIEGETMTSAP